MVTPEKQKLYEKQADIVKGFAHALRIAILDFVKDGEKCVCDIAEQVGAEQSNVSRHLALMVSSGVLVSRKQVVRENQCSANFQCKRCGKLSKCQLPEAETERQDG